MCSSDLQFIAYKSQRAGKAYFKVPANYTSLACAACGHTHQSNRKNQSMFHCEGCGHTDNADQNAALVIKQRAISLVKDSGAELSKRGVLTLRKDKGRGAEDKSLAANVAGAIGYESSKKKRKAATKVN